VTGRGVAFGPIPTLGFLHDFDLAEGLRFGAGILGDVPLLQNWPEVLNDGSPAPQRYAIINYEGTVLLKSAVGLAYRLGDWVSVGATFQILMGVFSTTMAISSCDGVVCTHPENPDYDATIRVRADDVFSPGVQVGIIGKPVPWLRLGVAWESGYEIARDADLQIRMPSSPLFDDARVDPAQPTVEARFSLPMQLRAGIEGRYDDLLRVEAAFVWEPWSVHDTIDIDARGVTLRDVELLREYSLSTIQIDRGFRDTWSIRLGAEAAPPIIAGRPLSARFGMFYEPSAVPDDKLTAMAVDFDKLGVCLGAAYQIGSFTFEATYAYVHLFGRDVTGSTAAQINPTRPQLAATSTIGDGSYQGSAHIFGVGASMQLGE
jgi:long-chain fatty acid transport protein